MDPQLIPPRGSGQPGDPASIEAAQLLIALEQVPVGLAIGVACAFLLHCAETKRREIRRVLNEPVIREGFRGVSLLEVLTRVSQ